MPTYHYRCKQCSHEFEEFQKMTDDSLSLCPECETNSLTRIIGRGAGLLFKGNGYYQTDYKKNTPTENSSVKSESQKTPSPSETTTQTASSVTTTSGATP